MWTEDELNFCMKANAPEKVYVYIPDDDIVGTASTQKEFPHQFVTEEYIRTDAFIEKLKCWLNENGREYYGEFDEGFLTEFRTSEEAIEDFRNYIKGE